MAEIVRVLKRQAPRQSEIADYLRSRILSGEFEPGAQLPSVAELQSRFGAGQSTVKHAVDYLRRAGYVATRRRRGTFVRENPPHLCHFGLVTPYVRQPDASQFFQALDAEASTYQQRNRSSGLRFSVFHEVISPDHSVAASNAELIAAVRSHSLGGLIFAAPPTMFAETPVLKTPDVPVAAVMNVVQPGMTALRFTGLVERMLDIAAARGCQRVAFIAITIDPSLYVDNLLRATQARGMQSHPWWVHGVHPETARWASHCAQMIFHPGQDELPDALIVTDDNLVPAATEGLRATGLRTPEDVFVVAHTNFPHPTPSAVPAVRVGFDMNELLELGVGAIRHRLAGEEAQSVIDVPLHEATKYSGP